MTSDQWKLHNSTGMVLFHTILVLGQPQNHRIVNCFGSIKKQTQYTMHWEGRIILMFLLHVSFRESDMRHCVGSNQGITMNLAINLETELL